MKKTRGLWRRAGILFMTVVMMVLMAGLTASAAGIKTVNMKKHDSGAYYYEGDLKDKKTTVYHKITVKKSGVLVVSAAAYNDNGDTSKIKITLCSSKKKSLENTRTVDPSSFAAYGVKKGTYYIKVSKQQKYVVAAAFEAAADKGGASKKKATTIKAGKIYTGVMPVGESGTKADWFKFKVTKSGKKLSMMLENATDGTVDFYVYGPGISSKGARMRLKKGKDGTYTLGNSATQQAIKAKKGTYYLKAVRYSKNKKSSGIYSVQWKLH